MYTLLTLVHTLTSTACQPQGGFAPAGFALQKTTDDRSIQQDLVPLSPDSPDAIFVPFTSRATKMGITEPDS